MNIPTRFLDSSTHPQHRHGKGDTIPCRDGLVDAFVRRLDTESVVQPARSDGRQRRYTRAEINQISAVSQMADDGMSLAGIRRILALEGEVAQLKRKLQRARRTG